MVGAPCSAAVRREHVAAADAVEAQAATAARQAGTLRPASLDCTLVAHMEYLSCLCSAGERLLLETQRAKSAHKGSALFFLREPSRGRTKRGPKSGARERPARAQHTTGAFSN